MSKITDFYKGAGTDNRGRLHSDILKFSDADLERVHDFIQWLFPLREPSKFNPKAPVLTDEDVAEFLASEEMRAKLGTSFDRMMSFYHIGDACPWWAHPYDHNLLRLTRILSSLRTLGCVGEADFLLGRLEAITAANPGRIPVHTLSFWRETKNHK
jgi:hypothetical protein